VLYFDWWLSLDIENESFESPAILADNIRTGMLDAHTVHSNITLFE